MWGRNWLKKRKSKKAFRIIAMNQRMQKIAPFYLMIPKQIVQSTTQKKQIERIIEKHHKEIRLVQPLKIQVVHLHPSHHYYMLKRVQGIALHRYDLRGEIRRLQYLGFLQEQEYFRTHPTMARTIFQNMMLGKDAYMLQGGEKTRPIHLEILKNTVTKEMIGNTQGYNQYPAQEASIINYTLISQVIHEVRRQMKIEAWRTGGKELWKR